MRTRMAIGLLIALTSTVVTLNAALGSGHSSAGRTLSMLEASRIYGGVEQYSCGVDPRCTQTCNVNYQVDLCSSVTDPGTCYNATTSTNRNALNQKSCVVVTPGWECATGLPYVDDSCVVYSMCYWDSVQQACLVSDSQPCFSFPSSCLDQQLPQ
jgi:hypothetical protein